MIFAKVRTVVLEPILFPRYLLALTRNDGHLNIFKSVLALASADRVIDRVHVCVHMHFKCAIPIVEHIECWVIYVHPEHELLVGSIVEPGGWLRVVVPIPERGG